jgi:hypothetical protein
VRNLRIAKTAAALSPVHGDLLDRLIIATALEHRGLGIQVLEITNLYKPQPGQSGPRSGESLPTDHFEGPNLLLVDEGHKGTASAVDAAEERAWRTVREALAENGDMLGFIRGDLTQQVAMPLLAFIVTDTPLTQVKWVTGGDQEKREDLRARHVLMMDEADYLGSVLREMRATLA